MEKQNCQQNKLTAKPRYFFNLFLLTCPGGLLATTLDDKRGICVLQGSMLLEAVADTVQLKYSISGTARAAQQLIKVDE